MAKFRYTMQNILEIKYKLEEQAKSEYSLARHRLNQAEEKAKQLSLQKYSYQEELRLSMRERLDLYLIRKLEANIKSMEEIIMIQNNVIIQLELELEAAIENLRQYMVDRKTHEKLRENEFEDFIQEINLEEKKEIDELVSYTYNHRSTDS